MIKSGPNIKVFDTSIANNQSFFTGHMNLQTLEFDPYVSGYAFIIWCKLPKWLEEQYPGFRQMTQKNFKSFDGVSDMDLNVEDYSNTFNNNAYGVVSSISKSNTDFSIRHQEFSGSPIKNMYQYWISSIRDPRTDIATYPLIHNCEYSAKNHTGELLYVVTRPDVNNVERNNIEFAAYYTNVFPTKIPLSHFNYSQGDHSLAEIDISYRGTMNISSKVDEFAKKKLAESYSFVSEGMFDPEEPISSAGKNITEFTGDTIGITGNKINADD